MAPVNKYAVGQTLAVLFCPSPTGKIFAVTIDADDLSRVLAAGFWRVRLDQKNFYAYRSRHQSPRWLHHFIAGFKRVDHKNRRGLDNRKSNLRKATPAQNLANTGPRHDGFKGVTFHKQLGKYQAFLKHGGDNYYLGVFASPELAARAYDAKAKEIHGEFAYLNFPEAL